MLNDHFEALKKLLQADRVELNVDWYLAGTDQYLSVENVLVEFGQFDINRGSGKRTEWRCLVPFIFRIGSKLAIPGAGDAFMGIDIHNELVKDIVWLIDGRNILLSYLDAYQYLANTPEDRMLINSMRVKRVRPVSAVGNTLVSEVTLSAYMVFSRDRLSVLPSSVKAQLNVNE